MTIEGAVREGRVDSALDTIRSTVAGERRRTATEREAFEAFAEAVADVEPVTPTASDSGSQPAPAQQGAALATPTVGQSPRTGADAIADVRRAYESTVMALPFHERLYGETYAESLHEEFGPDLATALTAARTFTPAVKRTLREEITNAIETRETLLGHCDREADAVESAAETLRPLGAELREHDATRFEGRDFGDLDAVWTRLDTIRQRCDAVAAERQDVLASHRRAAGGEDPDTFVSYVYRDLAVTYPICALCSDLGAYAADVRERVETALANAD